MIAIGSKTYGHDQLAAFQETAHWGRLSGEQRSLWEAYLRRSETYAVATILRAIGAFDVTVLGLTPVPPLIAILPPMPPVTTTAATSLPTSGPGPSAYVVPPTFRELELARAAAEKKFRRNSTSEASSSSSSSLSSVTLTPAEEKAAIARAIANSDRLSGHGREPHGRYASSSSSATREADLARSRAVAKQKEIDKELDRKKNAPGKR